LRVNNLGTQTIYTPKKRQIMNILIHSGTVLTMHDRRIIRQGAIAVEGKTIVEVGKTNDLRRKYRTGYEKIDAKDKVAIPDLINTHQHAAMSLLRGYANNLPLQEWA